MPKGMKGFQKGHPVFDGAEKGWFSYETVGAEKNVNWKNGKTSDRERYNPKFRRITKAMILKNNFTCQVCKKVVLEQTRYVHLITHHIDEDEMNDDLDNLIVLCNSCHKKVHHKTAQIPLVQEVKNV